MHVFIGAVGSNNSEYAKRIEKLGWGEVYTFQSHPPWPKLYNGEPWILDNGAYSAYANDEDWDSCAYQSHMEKIEQAVLKGELQIPTFAIIPDIVGGGYDSLKHSKHWYKKMPNDWNLYLAVQDGITISMVDDVNIEIEGIFLGGTNRYKLTANEWCEYAHNNNLLFHYARAGTRYKIEHAIRIGADSIDSSFPLWTRKRFAQFIQIIEGKDPQLELF